MKKTFLMACVVIGTLMTLAACGSNDPVSIAKDFATAYTMGNFDDCIDYVAKDAYLFVDPEDMSKEEKAVMKAVQKQAKKMKYSFSVEDDNIDVEEDEATIRVTIKSKADGRDDIMRVNLEKSEKGKWEVVSFR
jgi:ketosteroid isomerase-like protein